MPATDDESATRPRPAAQSPVHPNELIHPNEHGAKNPARVDITETHVRSSGSSAAFLVAALLLAAMAGSIALIVTGAIAVKAGGPLAVLRIVVGTIGVVIASLLATSLAIVSPGETSVRQFFGKYVGTARRTGLILVPPLTLGKKVSIKVHNFETHELKVNDLDGNPVNIAAIVVWQVADTAQAKYAVEDHIDFVRVQSEAALRHIAMSHPYDNQDTTITLRGDTEVIAQEMANEVAARIALAGLRVVETRISSLAYASEIAQAMLQRQQAAAIIAAREKIVEGAVTMVQDALNQLEAADVVVLDDERRAAMVSNLLVVLCGESRATPIVNTGSLYQ